VRRLVDGDPEGAVAMAGEFRTAIGPA
jgi:hypothetical protein